MWRQRVVVVYIVQSAKLQCSEFDVCDHAPQCSASNQHTSLIIAVKQFRIEIKIIEKNEQIVLTFWKLKITFSRNDIYIAKLHLNWKRMRYSVVELMNIQLTWWNKSSDVFFMDIISVRDTDKSASLFGLKMWMRMRMGWGKNIAKRICNDN